MSIIDTLPYVHAGGDGGPRSRTQVVVIHVTDNTASDEAEASYATHRADKTSAHFYVDVDSVIRALPIGDVAYGCYPAGNAISVQFEFTGRDSTVTDAELQQAAPVIAEVCRMYGIPVRHLTPDDVRNGVKGLCGHLDITRAFGQGDHTDGGPGFPWAKLLAYVNAAAGNGGQGGGGGTPIPAPRPTPAPSGALAVDGVWGLATTRALQHVLGVTADGVFGPVTVRALQRRVGVTADGVYGPITRKALQRHVGVTADGVVGPVTVRALQTRLNAGRF